MRHPNISDHVESHQACAKLTLTLRVTGARSDGYHLLEAEMVTVDLCDVLTFSEGSSLDIHFEPPAYANTCDVPAGEENLVRRALRVVNREAAVTLYKRIPPGAGLGGGSADAAAVLRWAGCTDPQVAASLGADVPFCVVGGHAIVRGVGEEILAKEPEERLFMLMLPPFGISTAAVYHRWDELGGPEGDWGNDLEQAALAVQPLLREWRDALEARSGQRPRLAGSGSTWFVEGSPEELGLAGQRSIEVHGELARLVPVRTVRPC